MKTTLHILALCTAAFVSVARAQSCTQTPADPKADDKARALVCYLSTHTYISGQTDMADAERVKQQTGRYPAIVAFDFYSYTDVSGHFKVIRSRTLESDPLGGLGQS